MKCLIAWLFNRFSSSQLGPCRSAPEYLTADALKAAGGYSTEYPHTEDYALWLRMGEITGLANLPEPLMCYRLHLQSVSVTKREIQVSSALRAWEDACTRRGVSLPRPDLSPAAAGIEIMRKWAWWAHAAGHRDTARHYAYRGLLKAPFSTASWKLMAAAWR